MVKRIAACVREYRRDSLLTPLYVALEVLLEVLIPLVMADLIDRGIEAGDMGHILRTGAVLVVMALFSLTFGVLSGRYAARASAGLAKNLRRDIYYNVQNFSFSNLDKFSTAGIVTRLTTDVTNVQNAYQMLIRVAVRCPLMLVFAFTMTAHQPLHRPHLPVRHSRAGGGSGAYHHPGPRPIHQGVPDLRPAQRRGPVKPALGQ